MILIIESDVTVGKKLSDLLSRERVIRIDSLQQMLEIICKFKDNLSVIVTDIHQLHEIRSKKIIFKLCDKLHIDVPPIIGIYRDGDEKIKEVFEKDNVGYKLLKYNDKDCSFPDQYIEAIKEVCPGVHAEVETARETWLKEKETDDLFELHKWMKEEGLSNTGEKVKIVTSREKVDKAESKTEKSRKDYKKMYFQIKKEYDELLKYVKELTDSV